LCISSCWPVGMPEMPSKVLFSIATDSSAATWALVECVRQR
jgi:hypothetical protein